MNLFILVFMFFGNYYYCSGYYINPGPSVIATKGEVWPKPFKQAHSLEYRIVRPENFKFQAISETCKTLAKAFERYLKIIENSTKRRRAPSHSPITTKSWRNDPHFLGYLDVLNVDLSEPCGPNDIPDAEMNEKYRLDINSDTNGNATLIGETIWGVLRGLETFSQLLYPAEGEVALMINKTAIEDQPRYHYRGLLLDTSRHFIPVPIISQILNAMSFNKMNVFHWHIVDDQSFPYQSKLFPELSEKGAYHPDYIYTPEDVQKVIKHAARRGIRVISEFDTPGHTRSWGESHPELLTECFSGPNPNGYLGPLNPIKNSTYTFMEAFFSELVQVFPEEYLHLGGDEVGFECWESNADIVEWMKKKGITSFNALEEYYVQRLVDIVTKLNASSIVWEEVYANGVKLPKETVVHIWNNENLLLNTTSDGFRTIWSSCWYLDHLQTGGDWNKYYDCDPHTHFHMNEDQEKFVIGGEACMWSEVVDETNVASRIWPRASAVAEKLWSPFEENIDLGYVQRRLEEHTCRMNARGILAQPPNGAGYCL